MTRVWFRYNPRIIIRHALNCYLLYEFFTCSSIYKNALWQWPKLPKMTIVKNCFSGHMRNEKQFVMWMQKKCVEITEYFMLLINFSHIAQNFSPLRRENSRLFIIIVLRLKILFGSNTNNVWLLYAVLNKTYDSYSKISKWQ